MITKWIETSQENKVFCTLCRNCVSLAYPRFIFGWSTPTKFSSLFREEEGEKKPINFSNCLNLIAIIIDLIMTKMSVLADCLKTLSNAEKRGKRQVLLR